MSDVTVRELLDAWRIAERAVADADPADIASVEVRAEDAHRAYLDAVDVAAKARRMAGARSGRREAPTAER
jgi:hypothetical protein